MWALLGKNNMFLTGGRLVMEKPVGAPSVVATLKCLDMEIYFYAPHGY